MLLHENEQGLGGTTESIAVPRSQGRLHLGKQIAHLAMLAAHDFGRTGGHSGCGLEGGKQELLLAGEMSFELIEQEAQRLCSPASQSPLAQASSARENISSQCL